MNELERLKHELELAYQQLEAAGVPRGRARSVHNGIGVLAQRFNKAETATHATVELLKADLEKLRNFANAILEDWPNRGDVDACELQDLAVLHGLLAPVEVMKPCGEECNCAGYGDFPMQCFRKTDLLKKTDEP